MNINRLLVFILLACIAFGAQAQERKTLPYKNPKLPVEKRVKDLLSRMTLEEKFWQLFMGPPDPTPGRPKMRNGIFGVQPATEAVSSQISEQLMRYNASGSARTAAEEANAMQRFCITETRLGIPIIPFDEALHGLVRGGSHIFPAIDRPCRHVECAPDVARGACDRRRNSLARDPADPLSSDQRCHGRALGESGGNLRRRPVPVVRDGRGLRFGVRKVWASSPRRSILWPTIATGDRDSYPVHWTERHSEKFTFLPSKHVSAPAGPAR